MNLIRRPSFWVYDDEVECLLSLLLKLWRVLSNVNFKWKLRIRLNVFNLIVPSKYPVKEVNISNRKYRNKHPIQKVKTKSRNVFGWGCDEEDVSRTRRSRWRGRSKRIYLVCVLRGCWHLGRQCRRKSIHKESNNKHDATRSRRIPSNVPFHPRL